MCPYLIECIYSDNGRGYKGTVHHPFGLTCFQNGINHKFTQPALPQTNGKAERVIRTLMEMWHDRMEFVDGEHRKKRIVSIYQFLNTVKPYAGLKGETPFEVLQASFSTRCVNNAIFLTIRESVIYYFLSDKAYTFFFH